MHIYIYEIDSPLKDAVVFQTLSWYQETIRINIPLTIFFSFSMVVEPSSTLLPFNTLIHMVTIKLSSSNYFLWKSQLLSILENRELIDYVDRTIKIPPRFTLENSQTPNIKHVAWKHTDQRLFSLLLSSRTEKAMVEVVGLSTSREVWVALENTFNHHSKAREICLKDDLQLMKRGTRSVSEYACAFKALCD